MSNLNICILDYGSGNVRSVFNILKTVHDRVSVANDEKSISDASHLVLPGVGAFKASMEKIRSRLPLEHLSKEVLDRKKPFLGICVGMQVLADRGYEFEEASGLGWVPGTVQKLKVEKEQLPHIGWNSVSAASSGSQPMLLGKDAAPQDFYFVHSYHFITKDNSHSVGVTEYETSFTSVINRENIWGVQFHPEKSQKAGKRLFENFLGIRR